MNRVPAFNWPPRFMNQQSQYFVLVDGDGTILAKSPWVASVVRTGAGQYTITLVKPMPYNTPLGIFETIFEIKETSDRAVPEVFAASETELEAVTYDSAGNPADRQFYLYINVIPHSWFIEP